MYNLRIKQITKVIKISPKISVKTILMTKSVIMIPNSQKTNKSETIVGFGSKSLKFCLRIKKFAQMLEREVLFAKIRIMILNITKIHKSLVEKHRMC